MQIIAEITLFCPAKCVFCPLRKLYELNRMKAIMPLELFKKTLELFSTLDDNKAVVLSGGEPSTLENLEEYIKTAHKLGYTVTVVTNGFNPRRILDSSVDIIEVSIDRVGEAQERERGVHGLWNNILKLLEDNRAIIRTTLMKDNIEDVKKLREMFPDKIILAMPIRGAPELKPTPQQLNEIAKLNNVFISNNCPAGINSFTITPNLEGEGINILPCFIYREKLGTLTQFSKEELYNIINKGKKIPRFPCEK